MAEHTIPHSQIKSLDPEDAAAEQDIDLNHAPIAQLAPLIGEKCARALVDYRVHHGHFRSWDDVRAVSNMDEEAFVELKRTARIGTNG